MRTLVILLVQSLLIFPKYRIGSDFEVHTPLSDFLKKTPGTEKHTHKKNI